MAVDKTKPDKDRSRGIWGHLGAAFLVASFLFFGVGRDIIKKECPPENKTEGGKNPNQGENQFRYYDTVIKLLENEVSFNWQRLSCYLITNSILFAAWAIILAEIEKPPRILLAGIALLGSLLSVVWTFASVRGNRFHFFWLEKLRKFEEDKIPNEDERIFLPFEKLTKGEKIKFREKGIQLKWLAKKTGVGNFFVFLSTVFLVIYLLITIYSFSIPGLPWFFRDP